MMNQSRLHSTLIFLKRLGMFSSSNGRVPQSRAYNITPQLHTSTSGPAYNFPDITLQQVGRYDSAYNPMKGETRHEST